MSIATNIQDRELAKFRETGTGTVSAGVTLDTLIAGEDLTNNLLMVENRYSYSNALSGTAGTTTVKSGAGFLHSLVVNKSVASGVLILYDSAGTSATRIATLTYAGTLVSDPPDSCTYDVSFTTGLTIASSSALDVTVSYR